MASSTTIDETEMKEHSKENKDNLREFEHLHKILSKIPKKAQSGILKTIDLNLTCIDANEAYIVIGTNVGLVFLYCREDDTIQRLKTYNTEDVISQTRIHQGIDLQVAVGTITGKVYIFSISGKLLEAKTNQVQKFDVLNEHVGHITCLEWSTNGMKLYSSDSTGHILTTEVDFDKNECISSLLLVESGMEIIQMDYNHKSLLISTKEKSFIVRTGLKSQPITIGTQNHKMIGTFGACFIPGLCKAEDAHLYTARAGCRIWYSDMKGIVKNTFVLSSALSPAMPEISLLKVGKLQLDTQEFQFGKLKYFRNHELVTWSNTAIVVVNPKQSKVVAQQSRLNGITDVAVVKSGEIFILRKYADAKIIRISDKPEQFNKKVEIERPLVLKQKATEEKENVAKSFFKKAFAAPLKKLDVFVHETFEHTPKHENEFPKASPVAAFPVLQEDEKTLILKDEDDTVPIPTIVETFEIEDSSSLLQQNPLKDQADTVGDIVFSHKAKRKHRKRSKKENIEQGLHIERDDDSISITSNTSNLSADFPQPPQNTPISSDSSHNALQRADEMLNLIHNILEKDSTISSTSGKLKSIGTHESESDHHPITSLAVEIVSQDATDFSKVDTDNLDLEDSEMQSPAKDREMSVSLNNIEDIIEQTLSKCVPNQEDSHLYEKETLSKCVPNQEDSHLNEKERKTSTQSHVSETKSEQLSDSIKIVGRVGSVNTKVSSDNIQKVSESTDFKSDFHAVKSSNVFKKEDTRETILEDDFYSRYLESSYPGVSGDSTSEPPVKQFPPTKSDTHQHTSFDDVSPALFANAWSQVATPANVCSLSMSNSHIWFTDKRDNLHYSCIGGPQGIQWRKASGQASQISVSPSGHIVWRLHKNTVFVGTKICSNHPEGMKWVEAIREVAYIAVDDSCAWFLKYNGEVMMQRGLSLERPFFKSKRVECSHKLKQIYCRQGVVWAITNEGKLLVRTGVTIDFPEGSEWEFYSSDSLPNTFCNVAVEVIEHKHVGWVIDHLGQIWFCDEITNESFLDKAVWWQVPLSKYVLEEESTTTMEMIMSSVQKLNPLQLGMLSGGTNSTLISCSSHGLCLALNAKNNLHLCRGNIVGCHWSTAQPAQFSQQSTWKVVCASNIHLGWGRVWAQHTNGETCVFKEPNSDATLLQEIINFTRISSSLNSVWAVEPDGSVKIRAGVTAYCPEGTEWLNLSLSQLGDVHIVHLSCNSSYVWAVESKGLVFQRIGVKPPAENGLNPVWLPVDSFSDIIFTQVHIGPLDWMVWAIDNRRLIYVRAGIEENMPLGSEWIQCSGILAVDLALTNSGVWALSPSGEVYYRHRITRDSVCGNYWKKIPGTFTHISASAYDDLWAINTSGQLVCCKFKYIVRHQDYTDPREPRHNSTSSSVSDEIDWELL